MHTSTRTLVALAVGALLLGGAAIPAGAQAQAVDASAQPAAPTPTAAVPQEDGKPVVKADTKDNFDAVAAAIRQQMQPGGRWQYMDKGERATIDSTFADMGTLYGQFGSVDKMDPAAKARLLADQNTINAILTRRDGDRIICRSELPVGSHLPVKTCKSYAQIQAEQKGAQDQLRRLDNVRPQFNHGGGGH